MQRHDLPCLIPGREGRKDTILQFDSIGELADFQQARPAAGSYFGGSFAGGISRQQATVMLRTGDLSMVPESDKHLAKLEAIAGFEARQFRTFDDVAGGVPNVPAVLANQPLFMRQRRRIESQQAPLTVYVDLVSSAGIKAEDMAKRGAAVLALVRILASKRPVNLWAGCTSGLNRDGSTDLSGIVYPIDTAPLDLARAAHILTNQSVPVAIGLKSSSVNLAAHHGYRGPTTTPRRPANF